MDTLKIQNMIAVTSRGNHQGIISSVSNGVKARVLHNAAPSGYEAQISTLTKIKTKVVEQKFYDKTQLNPADFVPIKVGEGAFTEDSLYYKNFSISSSFGSGIIGQGTGTRKGKSEALFDKVRLSNFFWAKELEYSLIQVQQASMNAGSAINLIAAKEKAQKINWDLGIQETAFLGQPELAEIDGLLTLDGQGVNINTTDLTKPLSTMTSGEINTFVGVLIKIYRANCNKTAWPDTFLIPEADHLGLASFVSDVQTQRSKLDFLEQAFRQQTQNPNFKIGRCAYSNLDSNSLGVNRYTLYNNNSDTLEMNIPIDYTSTSFATGNGFDFSSVAYGQFSGVIALRPAEILYFDNSVVI
jgi:hypothetical protein